VRHRHGGVEHDFDAVISAARAGERWALGHLYETLAPAVAGFFRLQRATEPEDLTSEVFVGVVRNLPTFRGDEVHFRSWVFTIAYRRLADERRAASRRPPPRPLEEAAELVAPVDVEADVARLLATRRVRELCVTLPGAQRDVLLLRLVGGLTVDEVAAVMGRSRGAVKALQRRGLAAVTAAVDERGVPL
jgi:RNA polymerase sigma-70 factor (ECF subfamily)